MAKRQASVKEEDNKALNMSNKAKLGDMEQGVTFNIVDEEKATNNKQNVKTNKSM